MASQTEGGRLKDSQKMFLQHFMSKGILNSKEVRLLFKNCLDDFGEPYSEDGAESARQLAEFVRAINKAISPFHMEIRKGISEDEGSNHYVLVLELRNPDHWAMVIAKLSLHVLSDLQVQTSESAITRMASDYKPNELELLKKIIEQLVENESGELSSTEALNLTERLEKRMSKSDAESMLERLERDKYIRMTRGQVSLDTRGILELEQYIKDVYPDVVKICNICNKLCLKGQCCDNCGVKLHNYCAARYFSNRTNPICPVSDCAVPWPHSVLPLRERSSDDQASPAKSRDTQRRKRTFRETN